MAEEAAAVEEVTEAEAEVEVEMEVEVEVVEANPLCVNKLVLLPAPQSTAGRMRKRLTDNDIRATLKPETKTKSLSEEIPRGTAVLRTGIELYMIVN